MTIVEQICIAIVCIAIFYIVFAPWLAQIDISKNTESIAEELEEINKTLKTLEEAVEAWERRSEDTTERKAE